MKKVVIIIPFLIFILFTSCKDNGVGFIFSVNELYPANLNSSWEYSTKLITQYYDTLGNIKNIETIDLPNTIVKISSINDIISIYDSLIRFDYSETEVDSDKSSTWFINNKSELTAIAYKNPGQRFVVPKQKQSDYLTFEEFKIICLDINNNNPNLYKSVDDTVQFYGVPREVLKYPLAVGKNWVELETPFYRERTVTNYSLVEVNGSFYKTYTIEANMQQNRIKILDYISMDAGLIKREIIADSIMITSVTNPDSEEFGNITELSNLVRFKR